MPWNPEVYNQFKNIRYQPFFDLMNLVAAENLYRAADVGCGTGEQTSLLSQRFENCYFTGIDASDEMLAEADKYKKKMLDFRLSTIETFTNTDSKWDLIFSNAALQWVDNHKELFPRLISKLNKNGQLAVQMPFQHDNILNKILLNMVTEKPFNQLLGGFRREPPLLQIDDYATIMLECGLQELNISLKVYPIIAVNEMDLYRFISGSALIPYMERLDAAGQELFKSLFIERVKEQFPKFPAIYSFKRLLLYGIKR